MKLIGPFLSQTKIDFDEGDGELIDSDACISSEESEDEEVDGETELRDDTLEIAKELGILDPEMHEVTAALAATAQEKLHLRRLTKGMAKLAKGAKLQAEGLAIIQDVLAQNPSLQPLASVLRPYQEIEVGPSSSLAAAMPASQSGKPQIFQEGPINVPVRAKNGIDWKCRYCEVVMKSYGGAEAHIRKVHTKVFYGPCPFCPFTTAASSSFKEHVRNCEKKSLGSEEK